jgi:hypothetical protein
MPWKDPERVEARRSVSQRFRRYIATLMAQFRTPPEELLKRAEAGPERAADVAVTSARQAE